MIAKISSPGPIIQIAKVIMKKSTFVIVIRSVTGKWNAANWKTFLHILNVVSSNCAMTGKTRKKKQLQ